MEKKMTAKERIIGAAAVAALAVTGVALWKLVAAVLWLCHYAGMPV